MSRLEASLHELYPTSNITIQKQPEEGPVPSIKIWLFGKFLFGCLVSFRLVIWQVFIWLFVQVLFTHLTKFIHPLPESRTNLALNTIAHRDYHVQVIELCLIILAICGS